MHFARRFTLASILGLVLLAGLAACGKDDDATKATIVIGAEGQIPPLDPHRMTGTVGLRIADALFDPLVREDLTKETKEAPTLKPALAESWKISPDGKTYTFQIRSGVTFHDGTALDSAAVKANFDRLMDKAAPFFDQQASGAMSFLTRFIASTSTPDAKTFVMELKEPFADFLRTLTDRRMAMVSPVVLKQYKGDELAAHPVGTGPYIYDKYVQGQQLDLKRNDKFWGTKPKIEHIVFRVITDPTTLATSLQTGQIDLIASAGAQQVEQLKGQEGLTVQNTDPANQYFLRFNLRAAPTDNVLVRRAINYAVNRDAIATLTGGQIRPLYGPVPSGTEESGPGVAERYSYNPDKAKQLLAEAKLPRPLVIKFAVPNNGPGLQQAPQIASLIQQDLKAVGIDFQPQYLEFATLLTTEAAGYKNDINGSYNGWTTGTDSAFWLERMFSGGQQPPLGVNRGWYQNPEVDALFAKARGVVDDKNRNDLYREAAEKIADDAPWLFLSQDRLPRIFRNRVTGLVSAASVYFDYTTIGLR